MYRCLRCRGCSSFLMRFLRARNYDVASAAAMLQDCLEFRQQNRLSPARDGPDAVALSFEDLALEISLRPLLLYDMVLRDKSGRPMLIELVGRWDCEKIASYINTENGLNNMLRGHVVRFATSTDLLWTELIDFYRYGDALKPPHIDVQVCCELILRATECEAYGHAAQHCNSFVCSFVRLFVYIYSPTNHPLWLSAD